MTDIDISLEAVERLARLLQDWGQHDEGAINDARDDAANALRALSAALTKAHADVAKATSWAIEQHGAADRYAAALTESRAETAAAYERAAEMCIVPEAAHIAWDMRHGNFPKRSARHEFIAAMIRALATPDQTAARDQMIAEAEARGMQRAAEITNLVARQACGTSDEMRGAAMVECAILAMIGEKK